VSHRSYACQVAHSARPELRSRANRVRGRAPQFGASARAEHAGDRRRSQRGHGVRRRSRRRGGRRREARETTFVRTAAHCALSRTLPTDACANRVRASRSSAHCAGGGTRLGSRLLATMPTAGISARDSRRGGPAAQLSALRGQRDAPGSTLLTMTATAVQRHPPWCLTGRECPNTATAIGTPQFRAKIRRILSHFGRSPILTVLISRRHENSFESVITRCSSKKPQHIQ
jgi:hypothetical protein